MPNDELYVGCGAPNHNFEPRYEMLNTSGGDTKNKYLYDICTKCGKIIRRKTT